METKTTNFKEFTVGQVLTIFRQLPECKTDEDCLNLLRELHLPLTKDSFEQVTNCFKYWSDLSRLLFPIRQSSNISFSAHTRELATVIPIAEQFSIDPDIIFEWKYSKLFAIQLYNAEKASIEEKLMKQSLNKTKHGK